MTIFRTWNRIERTVDEIMHHALRLVQSGQTSITLSYTEYEALIEAKRLPRWEHPFAQPLPLDMPKLRVPVAVPWWRRWLGVPSLWTNIVFPNGSVVSGRWADRQTFSFPS